MLRTDGIGSAASGAPPRGQLANRERVLPLADAPTRRGGRCGRSARRSTSWSSTSLLLGDLVASPDESRHCGDEVEYALREQGVVCQVLWALDCLGNVRDHSVAPAAHLVTEDPVAPSRRLPTGPSATTPRLAPSLSRTGACSITNRPTGHAPRAQSGRGRKASAAPSGPPLPQRRVRSAAQNGRLRRAGASRGRP